MNATEQREQQGELFELSDQGIGTLLRFAERRKRPLIYIDPGDDGPVVIDLLQGSDPKRVIAQVEFVSEVDRTIVADYEIDGLHLLTRIPPSIDSAEREEKYFAKQEPTGEDDPGFPGVRRQDIAKKIAKGDFWRKHGLLGEVALASDAA